MVGKGSSLVGLREGRLGGWVEKELGESGEGILEKLD